MTRRHDPLGLPRILCLHGGGVNGHVFRLQCRTIINQLEGTFRLVFPDGPYASEPHGDILAVYGDFGPFYRWVPSGESAVSGVEGRDAQAAGPTIMATCLAAMDRDDGFGPWVGVLGFSQGARIALSLLLAQRRAETTLGPGRARTPFKFGVIMAGSPPLVHLDETRLSRPRHVVDAACVSTSSTTTSSSSGVGDGPFGHDLPAAPSSGEHVVDVATLHVHGVKDPGLERHRLLLELYCMPGTTRLVEWDAGHRLPIRTDDVQRVVGHIVDMARETGVVLTADR